MKKYFLANPFHQIFVTNILHFSLYGNIHLNAKIADPLFITAGHRACGSHLWSIAQSIKSAVWLTRVHTIVTEIVNFEVICSLQSEVWLWPLPTWNKKRRQSTLDSNLTFYDVMSEREGICDKNKFFCKITVKIKNHFV